MAQLWLPLYGKKAIVIEQSFVISISVALSRAGLESMLDDHNDASLVFML